MALSLLPTAALADGGTTYTNEDVTADSDGTYRVSNEEQLRRALYHAPTGGTVRTIVLTDNITLEMLYSPTLFSHSNEAGTWKSGGKTDEEAAAEAAKPENGIVFDNDTTYDTLAHYKIGVKPTEENPSQWNPQVTNQTLEQKAQFGAYIHATDDRCARLVIKAGQNIVLDLNGYTLQKKTTATHGSWSITDTDIIGNYGTLTITDTSTGEAKGTIMGRGYISCVGAVLHNFTGGVMTVGSVNVNGNAAGFAVGTGQYVIANDGGKTIINGASIYDTATSASLLVITDGEMEVTGNATLNHPATKTINAKGGNVTIENATISSDRYAIFATDNSKVTINSGVTINGTGTVKKDKNTAMVNNTGAELPVPAGYEWVEENGKQTLKMNAAVVGGVNYPTLADAFEALNKTNHTLTLIDNSAWTYKDVYWSAGNQAGSEDTLKAALAAAQTGTDNVQIVCRPGATIISDGSHYNVTNNVTIYANGADFGGKDLSIGTYAAPKNSTTTINIYDAKNLVVWGQPVDERADVWNVNFTDCVNDGWNFLMYRGETGKATINATLTGCKATGFKDSIIHTTADGSITIKNCEFANNCAPVNIAHKQTGAMTVTVENSTFTNCGSTSTENKLNQYAAPVRIVNNNAAGTVATEVTNCTFAGTVGNNGDILIGDGRDGKESKDVSLTVKNTAADVQAQKPGYYNAGTADLTKMMAKQVAENERLETSVNKLLPNAAKIGNTEYATLKEALESLSNTTEENVTIELLADQNVAGFTVDLSNSAIKTLTIQGNGKKLDSLVNGVDIDGKDGPRCPVINAKLRANATFSVDGIVAPNSLLFDTGNEASLVVMNSTFNESQTGYPAAKNITYQGNTFEFKGDASKYYTNNAYPIWYKTETTTRSIAFLNNKVTGPRGFHIETRSTDADKQVNIKANGNTFNLSDSMYENKTIALQLVRYLNGEIEFKDNQVNAYMGVCFFKDIAAQNDSKLTIKNNYTSGKLYGSSEWNADGRTTEEKIAAADTFARGIVEGRKSADNGSAITEGHTHNYVNGKCTICGQTAPSYSGGSSSYDPTYSVSTPSKTENGSVTVSPKSASKGDRVTVTVKPDSGYVLETLTVTDKNGNELTLKDKGNGKYTFIMPAGKVEVKATFMEDNSMLNFFYDVPNGAYFYEAVKWAVKNGITTGVGNDLFAPEQPCTRAQIVTFLWRVAGSPVVNYLMPFTDVDEGAYYAEAVRWAASEKIVEGTTAATFAPNATVTRAQVVTMLCRFAKAQGMDTTQGGMAIREFDDFDSVPAYAIEAMDWAVNAGVLKGDNNRLMPQNACTRAQIVTFLWRVFSK